MDESWKKTLVTANEKIEDVVAVHHRRHFRPRFVQELGIINQIRTSFGFHHHVQNLAGIGLSVVGALC